MNSDDLADATRAAKATEALLRDARSALRRVEKLTDAALATTTLTLTTSPGLLNACSSSWSITWCSRNNSATARSNGHYASSVDRNSRLLAQHGVGAAGRRARDDPAAVRRPSGMHMVCPSWRRRFPGAGRF